MDPMLPSRDASESRRVDVLLRLYCLAALVLTMFCGSMALFAFRECSVARIELQGRLEQIRVARREYSMREPHLKDFATRLRAFAAGHPDFNRVLTNHAEILSMFAPGPAPGAPASGAPSAR